MQGTVIKEAGAYRNYTFISTDMVEEPPLQTLAGGDRLYMYFNEVYLAQFRNEGVTGDMEIVEDLGLVEASRTLHVQAAVLADPAIRTALAGSPASQTYAAGTVVDDDCPMWVTLGACGTCAGCGFVGEIPPPCWGACLTCTYCLSREIPVPKPVPGPHPPSPKPRPYPVPHISHAGSTLVHTPDGLAQIRSLVPGDLVYTLGVEGELITAQVLRSYTAQAPIASVMFAGEDAIRSTRGHMVKCKKGWIPAGKIGQRDIFGINGAYQSVSSLTACEAGLSADETEQVVNLLLSNGEGYFVGHSGLFSEAL